jgi:hypothetical protein
VTQAQRTYSRCLGAGCGRLIWWVTTIGGKQMPMDPEPAADGNVVLVRGDDGQVRGKVLNGFDLPAQGIAYRPHHRTCPDSERMRRKRPSDGPKCRGGCGFRMDPWLSDHGWIYHVNCAPENYRQRRPE